MTDQEKAQRLLDMASRRLAGNEMELCRAILGHSDLYDFNNEQEHHEDAFARLCTEFAEYLR